MANLVEFGWLYSYLADLPDTDLEQLARELVSRSIVDKDNQSIIVDLPHNNTIELDIRNYIVIVESEMDRRTKGGSLYPFPLVFHPPLDDKIEKFFKELMDKNDPETVCGSWELIGLEYKVSKKAIWTFMSKPGFFSLGWIAGLYLRLIQVYRRNCK